MICILIRDFAVTQERCLNPILSTTPLVLVQAGQYRPKVIAMDTIARTAGITKGMTVKQSETLCPRAEILYVDEARYERMFMDISCQLLDITNRIEPEYQATSAVWYTDDTLMVSYLVDAIRQATDITPQIGIAQTKFPARVAAAVALPRDCITVPDGDETEFLSLYPISLLPLDKLMTRRLPLLGIHTLGQLAALPRLSVWEQFGKHGRWLHDLAHGKDVRPLSPFKPLLQLREDQDFEEGIVDRLILHNTLEKMSLRLVKGLDGCVAYDITLLLHMKDQSLLEYHRQPHDPIRDSLFLLRILTQMLAALPVHCAIDRLEVRLDNIQQRKPIQLSLFEENESVQKLASVLPTWAYRHRDAQFYRLHLTGDNHLPERIIERQKVVSA